MKVLLIRLINFISALSILSCNNNPQSKLIEFKLDFYDTGKLSLTISKSIITFKFNDDKKHYHLNSSAASIDIILYDTIENSYITIYCQTPVGYSSWIDCATSNQINMISDYCMTTTGRYKTNTYSYDPLIANNNEFNWLTLHHKTIIIDTNSFSIKTIYYNAEYKTYIFKENHGKILFFDIFFVIFDKYIKTLLTFVP